MIALKRPEQDESIAEFIPLLAYRQMIDGKPTAYVCQNYACQQPVTTPQALREQLAAL